MNGEQTGYVIIGIAVGLVIAYFLLWGQSYSELNDKYQSLNQNYIQLDQKYNQLNQEHILLQQNHTRLRQECGEILKEYKSCVDRETFFEWIDRLSSIAGLAKFFGLV